MFKTKELEAEIEKLDEVLVLAIGLLKKYVPKKLQATWNNWGIRCLDISETHANVMAEEAEQERLANLKADLKKLKVLK